MNSLNKSRSEARQVLFVVSYLGDLTPCAISQRALEDIAGRRFYDRENLLSCFTDSHERIEALALSKLQTRHAGVTGRLHLWSSDVGPLLLDGKAARPGFIP